MTDPRPEYLKALNAAVLEKTVRGHTAGWIFWDVAAKFDFELSKAELDVMATRCGYQPGWAWYRFNDLKDHRDIYKAQRAAWEARTKKPDPPPKKGKRPTWRDNRYDRPRRRQRQAPREREPPPPPPPPEDSRDGQWFHGDTLQDAWNSFTKAGSGQPSHLAGHLKRLGLAWPFTSAQLKAAHRTRAMATHPDRGGVASEFIAVQKSFEELEGYAKG